MHTYAWNFPAILIEKNYIDILIKYMKKYNRKIIICINDYNRSYFDYKTLNEYLDISIQFT